MANDFTVSSGSSIIPDVSGVSNLGSTGSYYSSVYANNLILGSGGSSGGPFVHVTGDRMTGDLTLNGASLTTATINSTGAFIQNVNGGSYVLNSAASSTTFFSPAGAMSFQAPNNGMTFNASGTTNFNSYGSINFNGLNGAVPGFISLSADTTLTLSASSGVKTFNNVIPDTSGTLSIGTTAFPFSGIFGAPVLKSPDGVQWRLTVSNTGMVTGVAY